MRTLLVAIHGIMTNQTYASWPDKLDPWMFARDPSVKVLKKEYRAGPFPRWNCLVLDGDPAHEQLTNHHSPFTRLREWLWGKLMSPYGCLGRTGWLLKSKPLKPEFAELFTRWYRGGHSTYFKPKNISRTFEQI